MNQKPVVQIANIRYHGDGEKLLLGKAIAARKQIGKKDIYQRQHWTGLTEGYAYKVPSSVHKNTPAQVNTRLRMRAAMLDWNALTDSDRDLWHEKAKGQPVMGHNLFVREWFKTHGFGREKFGRSGFGSRLS